MRSMREEGNVDNVARNDGGGISMVHQCGLKNLLMVKVRALEILKLRTTRKKQAKDRPTPPILASKTEGKNRIQPGWIRKFISVRKAQLDEAT